VGDPFVFHLLQVPNSYKTIIHYRHVAFHLFHQQPCLVLWAVTFAGGWRGQLSVISFRAPATLYQNL